MGRLPLTDVVGSTRLWEGAPAAMADAIDRHERLLREAPWDLVLAADVLSEQRTVPERSPAP